MFNSKTISKFSLAYRQGYMDAFTSALQGSEAQPASADLDYAEGMKLGASDGKLTAAIQARGEWPSWKPVAA